MYGFVKDLSRIDRFEVQLGSATKDSIRRNPKLDLDDSCSGIPLWVSSIQGFVDLFQQMLWMKGFAEDCLHPKLL